MFSPLVSTRFGRTLAMSTLVHTSTNVLHSGILMEVCNLKHNTSFILKPYNTTVVPESN